MGYRLLSLLLFQFTILSRNINTCSENERSRSGRRGVKMWKKPRERNTGEHGERGDIER